jgi:hypothetical protein
MSWAARSGEVEEDGHRDRQLDGTQIAGLEHAGQIRKRQQHAQLARDLATDEREIAGEEAAASKPVNRHGHGRLARRKRFHFWRCGPIAGLVFGRIESGV